MLTRDGDAKPSWKIYVQTIRSSSISNGNRGGIDELYRDERRRELCFEGTSLV